MMQRSIVAASMPAAACHGANRYGVLTAAPCLLRLQEKNVSLRDRSELMHRRKSTDDTDGVSMEGRLPKSAGRFLVV